jgi:hypothetical protein
MMETINLPFNRVWIEHPMKARKKGVGYVNLKEKVFYTRRFSNFQKEEEGKDHVMHKYKEALGESEWVLNHLTRNYGIDTIIFRLHVTNKDGSKEKITLKATVKQFKDSHLTIRNEFHIIHGCDDWQRFVRIKDMEEIDRETIK